ncbi:MAG: hypothetical protein AB2L12_17540 [Smithellaceae bacterium]
MKNTEINFIEEAVQALNDPAQQSESDIAAAFEKWNADLKAGALQNLDALILRDRDTPLEKMWRTMREGYDQLLNEHKEHAI